MPLNRRSGPLFAALLVTSLGMSAQDCEPVETPTPDPATPTPVGTPTPCDDGFGLCEREANTTCLFESFAEAPAEVAVERAFPALSFSQPVFLTHAPGDDDTAIVLEKSGRALAFDYRDDVSETFVLLDMSSKVASGASEMGFLGMAFHPDYANNGYVFVDYTAASPRRTVISRMQRDNNTGTIDPDTEVILLEVNQPYGNHNGGMIAFGPDGHLYVGLGDGGSAGDPVGAGQDPDSLLATILRLDVDTPRPGLSYGWPDDNPFVSGGGRPEIYAWGLRNPWRFSFDSLLGTFWVGDVGQDAWEEIDVIERGGNYGWNTMEGTHCYSPSVGCNTNGLELPVIEYAHSEGRSVTGGYVYRGPSLPELTGRYLYGDYANGRIWAATWDGEAVTENQLLIDTSLAISSFGEGPDGEVFVVHYAGSIHRLVRAASGPQGVFPTRLSDTGCFADVAQRIPAPGVLPYTVNSPLWSDGDLKGRFFAVPGTETVGFTEEGAWSFPDGSSLWKDFYVLEDASDPTSQRLLETRLMLKLDGEWRGYTYKWNDEQTDAFLLEGALIEDITVVDAQGQSLTRSHLYPSRSDCQSCHTDAAGFALGLRTGQMNADFSYWGVVDNQLRALDHIGVFEPALGAAPEAYVRFPNPASAGASLNTRARSYMEANCAHCHVPGGTAVSNINLSYHTALEDTMALCVEPDQGDMGVSGALIIAPGEPERSTLSLRMHTLGDGRMPTLASSVVDELGVEVIDGWIEGLAACP